MLEQIKASAGSGKTYTLTRRFLEQLNRLGTKHDALPCRRQKLRGPGAFSEILAMTFTNKAAAEMKSRVLAALKNIALREDDSPDPDTGISPAQARAWVEIILRRYDALNIRTIDSFLNLMLQISAINLGIPPDFELAFDEREFLEPLYDELLDKAAQGDEEVSGLLRDCAAYLLNKTSFSGLTPRGRIRNMLLEVLEKLHGLAPEDLPCIDQNIIEAGQNTALEALAAAINRLDAQLERLSLKPNKPFMNFLEKLRNYAPGEKFPTSKYMEAETFQDCCNKAEKCLVDESLEAEYQFFCASIEESRKKIKLYASALELLPFARLAMLLLPEIQRLQGESGQIAASLKERLAGEVLNAENGVSEACCRLGSRLNHILIDEFQDTSRAQWQAILPLAEECLSRGGSLRYVGDVKQAIYSWRGGDSSLFDEVAAPGAELSAIEPEPLFTPLEYNWRSAPEVVRHNNEFFSRLADPALAYLVVKTLLHKDYPDDYARMAAQVMARSFEGTAQKIPDKTLRGPQGLVRMQKVGGNGQSELQEDVRGKLEALFRELMQRRKPGDIAVLIRNKTEAALVADWLSEWGIGFVTEHSFKLSGNPLIRRIISLLRWLDYPSDDLSFMDFISGNEIFCRSSGLGPDALLRWESEIKKREKKAQALFRHFKQNFPVEWSLWLEPFYNRSRLMSAYDTVSEIYNRYSLLAGAPGHAVYLRRFLELALSADTAGYSSLSGFLEFWDDKGQEEKIPAPDNPDAVRLMTMHKAKGLEFKVVIIPFHRFSGRSRAEAVTCMVDDTPLLVKDCSETGKQYYLGQNSSALEIINLLYVAWTRAGEELHLFIGGSKKDHDSAGLAKALDFLLQEHEFSESGNYTAGETPPQATSDMQANYQNNTPGFMQGDAPDDEDWMPMGWLPKLKIFRTPVPELVYDERVRGILFHNCLENLYIDESAAPNLIETIRRTVDSTMRGFHMPVNEAGTARKELEDALGWFCSLPRAPYWLSHGRAEQTIMDENGANHRVDMLVREKDGSLLVLEYKSGRQRPEYADQLRRYLRLLKNGTGNNVRGIIVYLDCKKLEEFAI